MTVGPDRELVRAPNHLGDVVMALPALRDAGADVLVVRWLAPLVEMAGLGVRVIPFDRGWSGWRAAVRTLRAARYRRGTLLTPAFSAAWLCRWGGVRALRGLDTDGRGWMLAERLPRAGLRGLHRLNQYRWLLGQPTDDEPRLPRLTPPETAVAEWRERLGAPEARWVGLFPGSHATARRWPVERFAAVGRGLVEAGARVVVIGAPAERALTHAVASRVPGAVDAGGRTDLVGLAAVLSLCDLVVTNDSGPMHVAGAVGARTLTLWGPSDPAEVGPPGAAHLRVTGDPLPCKPCFKNACPRSGRGAILPDAHEECMHLITVEQVGAVVRSVLEGSTS